MKQDNLSWQQVVAYLVAASISATLLMLGKSPEIAALPSFLVWMMINRNPDGSW
jgi:hypothetical protein